jgi:hypothetical protein
LLPAPEAGSLSPEADRARRNGAYADLAAVAGGGGVQDLFAEAPLGWYFETRKSTRPDEFLIVEVKKPRIDSRESVPVTLTLRNEQQSYEFAVDLDATSGP